MFTAEGGQLSDNAGAPAGGRTSSPAGIPGSPVAAFHQGHQDDLLTNQALADLKDIGRFTQARWGRQQRLDYLTMLDDCFRQLAADPLIGQDAGEICTGYRKHRAGRHVIFNRWKSEEAIEIVRILHGRMDIETRLNEQ